MPNTKRGRPPKSFALLTDRSKNRILQRELGDEPSSNFSSTSAHVFPSSDSPLGETESEVSPFCNVSDSESSFSSMSVHVFRSSDSPLGETEFHVSPSRSVSDLYNIEGLGESISHSSDLYNIEGVSESNPHSLFESYFSDSTVESLEEFDENDEELVDEFGISADNFCTSFSSLCHSLESGEPHLKTKLANWSTYFGLTDSATSELLHILKNHPNPLECTELPLDARTLKNSRMTEVVNKVSVPPGHYVHIGVEKNLRKLLKYVTDPVSEVRLLINVDGLPLFRSSKSQLWPILGKILSVECLKDKVFTIGLYHGFAKPENPADYLKDFIEEITLLINNGFILNNLKLSVKIGGFVCDAPAKSFLLCTKGHTGYSSCSRCTQRGVWSNSRVVFPETDAPLRTHQSFLSQEDSCYHKGVSPLISIPGIDLIRMIPLDYMHLCCLGVMKALILCWLFSGIPNRLSAQQVSIISGELLRCKSFIPIEYPRKCRALSDVKHWKATEFRMFILYVGPLVMKDFLPKEKYEHFISFHVAMLILLSPVYCSTNLFDYAHSLLKHFVESFPALYSKDLMTHNVHGLSHLADDVEMYGNLDNCSSFPFENHLFLLKKKIRKGDKVLEQALRKLKEEENSYGVKYDNSSYPKFLKPYNGEAPFELGSNFMYGCIDFKTFKITNTRPNNCCTLKDGKIVLVKCICSTANNGLVIVGKEFTRKYPFYQRPCNSSLIDIFEVGSLSGLKQWHFKEIRNKNMLLKVKTKVVSVPILHTRV